MIEGLKLTMTGVQLRANIDDRIRWHQKEIARVSALLKGRERVRHTEHAIPEAVLENDLAEAERRIGVLTFIRDYIVLDEVYRLGEFDLRFADLLPDDEPFGSRCIAPVRAHEGDAVLIGTPEPQ